MNPVTLFKLFFMPTKGWQDLLSTQPSIPRLFMLHVIPFSLIPSLMIYIAGMNNSFPLLEIMPSSNMLLVAVSFFVIQLIAVPIMATVLRQLGEVAEVHPNYKDSFILAAVAPTPLWLAPVFLIVPNILFILAIFTLAMMAAFGIIFYGLPTVLNVRDEGRALFYFGGIVMAGMVASAFLFLCVLVIWGSLQSLQFAAA
jgi:hypothetical protein